MGNKVSSSATLCRFENSSNRQVAVEYHRLIVEQFIDSYSTPPRELILDFDATDSTIYGEQEGRFFHGYYGDYCFLPLYVYCGKQLLISYLRRSNQDQAKHSWAILSLLVKRLRQSWPDVKIIFRGDCGFNRHKIMNWCEKNAIDYIIGQPKNNRLAQKIDLIVKRAEHLFEKTEEKQKDYTSFQYEAQTWSCKRRVITKVEHMAQGGNQRFIVTTLKENPQELYEKVYCARGDMENRIKEVQLYLFAERTSCHKWWANQFRMILSGLAYILIERMKALALKGTELATAYPSTIRLKLFKVGAVIIKNTRRVRFLLPQAYPYKNLFIIAAKRLC